MSDESMPPLGPPYGPADPPPAPRFPAHPPTEWAPPPFEPFPAPMPMPDGPNPNRRALAIGAAVIVLLLLVGTVTWLTDDDPSTVAAPQRTTTTEPDTNSDLFSSDSSSSDSSSSDPSATTTTEPKPLDLVIEDIKAFVERERGLKFKADVPVALLANRAFESELLLEFDKDTSSTKELGQVLTALGLVDPGTDVVADLRQLVTAGVVGFYDPKTKRLVVRGSDTTPYVRKVLAHELTHALDDQYFNLDRDALDKADDESSFGFSALAEGDARRIEDKYYASLSFADQSAADEEERALVAASPQIYSLPPVLLVLLVAPYDDGEPFVQKLLDAGGQPRLDGAFTAPPTTREQVIEPDDYLAGQGAAAVADPQPDGTAAPANRGVLGVLLLQQLLAQGLPSIGGSTSLEEPLKQWGGDKYVTWTDGERTCIRDAVVGDTPEATTALFDAFADWAASPGVTAKVAATGATPSTGFAITACA